MKRYSVTLSENLNLVTVKNISCSLRKTIEFLEENEMCLVTCNIKPSGFTDIIFSAKDKYISKIATYFKSDSTPHNTITVRSGVSRLSILGSSKLSIDICKFIVNYFNEQGISIERLISSKNEIQLFFPASEFCGSVRRCVEEFESYLQTYKNMKKTV